MYQIINGPCKTISCEENRDFIQTFSLNHIINVAKNKFK